MKVAVLHPDAYMAYSVREGTKASPDISLKIGFFKTCYGMTGPNLYPNPTEGNRILFPSTWYFKIH